MRKWNCQDCKTMPWKNGGGRTTELAVFPPGATLEDFVWRLSSAYVESAGQFSHFAGVDRSLAILSGDGLVLNAHDEQHVSTRVRLDRGMPPYCFPGELAIHAELCGGPVLDLNMMTRRAICSHFMRRLVGGEYLLETTAKSQILLYCVAGTATLSVDEGLQAGDLAMFEEAGRRFHLTVDEGTILYLMRITSQVAP